MAKKLTQEEIDQLIKDSDQEIEEKGEYEQEFENEVAEEYPDDHEENEVNEEIGENPSNQSGYKIEDQPQVESEMASENADEIVSENYDNDSEFQFKKDEDLSQAKSEFIQSSRLNEGLLKIKSNMKTPQNSKQAIKDKNNNKPKTEKQPVNAKPKVNSKKTTEKKTQKQEEKVRSNQNQDKQKEKRSDSEINRRMKDIEDSKKEMQRKKLEKQKKEEEIRRKQYEQAKQQDQQRKEKNRKILEQQQKAKKKPIDQKSNLATSEVKIPQKCTDFKYMEMKKERIQNEKQIQKQIEVQNLQKLKKLNENRPKQLKGDAKKMAILQQRNYQLQRQKKQKKKEEKEDDVLIIKQIKKEIVESKRFNLEKNQQINRAERNIEQLKKKVKEKEKVLYLSEIKEEANKKEEVFDDLSELSPIEKFVYSFPQSKSVDDIFNLIDTNGDGVLSTAEIHQKLTEFNLSEEIINKVEEILDENSDGTVSHEQFVFLVELELKRQKDYKQIMGDINSTNPIDMEVKILDMQAKMKYINKQIENHDNSSQDQGYEQKLNYLQKKADKIENKIKKEMVDYMNEGNNKEDNVNSMANLTNEYVKLKNEKGIKLNFLQKLRTKVKGNLSEKNRLLASRVEENLRLEEQVYKIKNEIQQRELRFLSMKKIEANKRGYLERQTQKRRQLEEAHKRTKEYQILMTDPSKKAQKNALAEEMKFLAAVIMIQRNYRKKKARGQLQKLEQVSSK